MTYFKRHLFLLLQAENMKATSHCGSTKGGTRSLERQALCTREVTGRRRRHRTGACVLTSSNPGTHPRSLLTSLDRHLLFLQYLISGAQLAYEHHVDFVSMRMCMFHTLSNLTVPPNVHTHFVFTLGKNMCGSEVVQETTHEGHLHTQVLF